MIRCPDNQINASFIDISRIKWLVFYCGCLSFRTTSTVASSEAPADYQPAPGRTDGVSGEASKTMDYKFVFTILCLELQQNRSWIKGLGKNPQKSELIHWRQCLWSGGTEACSLGLRETRACIHVIQRLSQATSGMLTRLPAKLSKNGMRVYTLSDRRSKKIACLNGLRSEGVKGLLGWLANWQLSIKIYYWPNNNCWLSTCETLLLDMILYQDVQTVLIMITTVLRGQYHHDQSRLATRAWNRYPRWTQWLEITS